MINKWRHHEHISSFHATAYYINIEAILRQSNEHCMFDVPNSSNRFYVIQCNKWNIWWKHNCQENSFSNLMAFKNSSSWNKIFISSNSCRNFLLLSMDFPIRSYLQGNSSNWNRFGLLKKIYDALKIKNNTFNCIWQWILYSEHITSFCIFSHIIFTIPMRIIDNIQDIFRHKASKYIKYFKRAWIGMVRDSSIKDKIFNYCWNSMRCQSQLELHGKICHFQIKSIYAYRNGFRQETKPNEWTNEAWAVHSPNGSITFYLIVEMIVV